MFTYHYSEVTIYVTNLYNFHKNYLLQFLEIRSDVGEYTLPKGNKAIQYVR
uniref:Uncharacterized protein n=1 Tax=Anguilla anguilla TaxID=7936 RepID=A0A0E9S3B7_ANGAN